jgi:hypothetical protein
MLIKGRNGLRSDLSAPKSSGPYPMPAPSFSALAALSTVLLLTACRRDEVVSYSVPKESSAANTLTPASTAAPASAPATPAGPAPAQPGQPPAAQPSAADADAAMRNTAVNVASGPGLAWDAPAGWTPGPERPMRKATLVIGAADGGAGAELAVTAFPGDVGGNLANVNRWRQQLGLPPIGQDELGSALQHLHVGPLHVDVVELVGPARPPAAPQRVLGAIVPYEGATWFFKLTGPDSLVTAERERFLAFIRSVRPTS